MIEATMVNRKRGGPTRRYPQGSVTVSVVLPTPVFMALEKMANEGRQSLSSIVGEWCELRLKAEGRLDQ